MSEPASEAPRLWTPDGFREDGWTHAETADALAGNGRFILPLETYLALDAAVRRQAGERLGVLLKPAEAVGAIVPHLAVLPLVALSFPAFNDGRSFSKAELLRSRYGFTGVVRATGQVLVDQLPHMLRLGFDEFEVVNPVLIKRLETGRTGGIPLYYQPAADEVESPGPRYSWRRRPRA